MGCSNSVAAQVKTEEVEVVPDEIAEYNRDMSKITSSRSNMPKSPSQRSTRSTTGSSSSANGKAGSEKSRDTSKTSAYTSALEDGAEVHLDFSGTPNQEQGSDLAVELAMTCEVEADQAEGETFHSWAEVDQTESDGKRDHLSHEVKLARFLQSIAADDMEKKVKQMRKRDAAKSMVPSLSSARPQISMQPHLNSDDSFHSSEC
ncbi:unnamed protein product [Polarella glacialis]|uniref:Uncharacterized protein n=1 Tax=Polarella glacialis TaxID=89957 RepID=A0A813ILC3_POLGL|nr:unnamed protein product [Polarella glacialis]